MNLTLAAIASCVLILASAGVCGANEWVKLGETVWGTYHYDKASVKKGGRFVTVTSKQNLNVKTAEALEEALPNAKGVAYAVVYELIDCEEGLYKQNSIVYYDRNDRVIYDSELTRKKYREVAPRPIPLDTPIGWLAETVCEPEEQTPAK